LYREKNYLILAAGVVGTALTDDVQPATLGKERQTFSFNIGKDYLILTAGMVWATLAVDNQPATLD
jgi:hypothetical protein